MSKSTGKKLVIVESPTKAKTIRKFLGKEYTVESCMGHVRDLPQSAKDIPEKFKKEKWANLGVNVTDDFDPIYCVPKTKTRIVKTLKEKLADVEELILATDEDREGESISWHLVEVLKPKVPVKRMVFHEITKEAIQEALEHFRAIDADLVRAQEARRILDRLVGYSISPLLWKKVTYGLSAGRVQSVAVRLIAEREHERLRFRRAKYWSLTAQNEKDGVSFESRSFTLKGKRVAIGKDFDSESGELLADKKAGTVWLTEKDAVGWVNSLAGKEWTVSEVEEKPISRKPAPPFITSTLQQEANRKLGFTSRETMELAQKLYERGFITYMRTDSTNLSTQAIGAARETIQKMYGKSYLPGEPRIYTGKKSKGAQEAHEAIRPAGKSFVHPEEAGLSGGMQRLYELIWKRTVASQMNNSEQKLMSVKFTVQDAVFAASGMTIEFPGFLKVYVEEQDDDAGGDEKDVRLPKLKVGDKVKCAKIDSNEHETKPPARFTEASLVQTMEKEGIGRPSTYATIIGTIQDRGYVRKVGNALVPTFTALVVSKLLRTHLPNYVDLGFTSEMERSLDTIAQGDMDHIKYLNSIYFGQQGLKSQVETQEKAIDAEQSRSIQLEGLGALSFRIGKYGAYVCRKASGGEEVCASLPESQVPGDMTAELANKLIDQKINGTDALGKDPKTGLSVFVLSGRYGPYVQLGDNDSDQLKRMAIPATLVPEELKIEQALALLELPKKLGVHPDSGKDIKKGLGRFGPYVVHEGDYRSIPRTENIFDVDLKRALELFAQPKRMRGRSAPLKELGVFPDTQEQVQVHNGKYGPYIKVGAKNISLPEDMKPEELTLDMVLPLIRDKIATGNPRKGARKATVKTAAKASKTKKATAAKTAAAKTGTKPAKPPAKTVLKKAAKTAPV
ncbi:MAG TPA: type I DNA topoisomerase [Bdellovibrionales bacterium]|nr:type I DNA topoisomerase [Bdellovibrionales bacterium]